MQDSALFFRSAALLAVRCCESSKGEDTLPLARDTGTEMTELLSNVVLGVLEELSSRSRNTGGNANGFSALLNTS